MRFAVVALTLAAACYQPVTPGAGGGGDGGMPEPASARLGVGARFACMLDDAGAVQCWGDDTHGEIGDGSAISGLVRPPTAIPAAAEGVWTAVAVGASHACAVAGGHAYCWGDGSAGQLGSPGDATTPKPVPDLSSVTALAAGQAESCGLDGAGGLACWGNLTGSGGSPVTSIGGTYASVSVGADAACAVTSAGAVRCWGACLGDQCGTAEPNDANSVALFDFDLGGATAARVVAGDHEVCALDTSGGLHCAGGDAPLPADSRTWTDVALGPRLGQVATTCGVSNGSAYCWGTDTLGSIPDGTWGHPSAVAIVDAVAVAPATNVVLGMEPGFTLDYDEGGCLLDGSAVSCWGANRSGELATGVGTQQLPTAVVAPDQSPWQSVASSDTHTCGTTQDQHLYCWGQNDAGEITGDPASCPDHICAAPTLAAVGSAASVMTGAGFTCVGSDETVVCWGDNTRGQLGAGSAGEHAPQTIDAVAQLRGGGNGACAIDTNTGTDLVCWGGWQGIGPFTSDQRTPNKLVSNMNVESVVVGQDSACLSDTTGARTCFGNNAQGELGGDDLHSGTYTNNATDRDVVGSVRHYCDLEVANGFVACWGTNYDNESGVDNSEEMVMTPEYVDRDNGGAPMQLNNCGSVSVGQAFGCASCNTGIACWGRHAEGMTGQPQGSRGTDGYLAEPVTVNLSATGDLPTLVGGGQGETGHTCARDDAGTLVCWGFGPRGELGTGVAGSPVPIPISVP
nr:hypothetical protein [Kofleriaceae bacterium]